MLIKNSKSITKVSLANDSTENSNINIKHNPLRHKILPLIALLRCNNDSAVSGNTMKIDFPRMGDELHINNKSLESLYPMVHDQFFSDSLISLGIIDQCCETNETRKFLAEIWQGLFRKADITFPVNHTIIDELITNCNQAGYTAIFSVIFNLYFNYNQKFKEFIFCTVENRKVNIEVSNQDLVKVTCLNTITVFQDIKIGIKEICKFNAQIKFELKSNNKSLEYKEINFYINNIDDSLKKYVNKKIASLAEDFDDLKEGNLLHVYTKIGSINAVKFLITSGADVYHRDKNGATALHYANIPEIICTLIEAVPKQERKFYSNIQDNDGNTPLHYLARRIQIDNKYSEIVKTLLEKGANPYVKNKDQLDAPKICNNHHFLKCIDSFERDKQFKNFCKIAVGAIILLGAAQLLLISNSMSLILLCFISTGIIYFGRRDDHYYITDVKVNELSKSLKDEINASK